MQKCKSPAFREILNLESFILFARYSLALTSRCLSNPISLLDPAMSRSSFPIRTAETLDQGGGLPSTVCPCLTATVKYHYSCLPQSVRSNIAGNDVDYPPFLMPPLSMFRVIYEIEARHKDEILLILLILEFPSMFDPCEQRLLFQQCNNYETCYSSSNRYILSTKLS